MFKIVEKINVYSIVLLSVLLHLIFLPFAQSVDADATTRVLIAEHLIDHPEFITHGIWLPLHHYYNVLGILLTGEHLFGPMLLNIFLVSLTAVPIFKFTAREVSSRGAWFATLLFVLSPIVFRNTYFALSGIPFLFFIACAINFSSKSLKDNSFKDAIWAGVFMTIAAGFRYEGWLLIALLTLIYLLKKRYKLMFIFWVFAMIFPAFWMFGNYMENGDLFSGLTGAYDWNIGMEGVNDSVDVVDKVKRILFFPISWVLIFSPFIVFSLIVYLLKKVKSKTFSVNLLIWSIPFFVFFIFFIYKSMNGTLLNQHRFTQSLVLLSIPFTALLYDCFLERKYGKYYVGFVLFSMLPFSYLWMKIPIEKVFQFSYTMKTSLKEIRLEGVNKILPVPRLNNQEMVVFKDVIEENSHINESLILDFENWENTFYLGINAPVDNEQLFMVDGAKNGGVYLEELLRTLHSSQKGMILLNKASKFSDFYQLKGKSLIFDADSSFYLDLKKLKSTEYLTLFSFEVMKGEINSDEEPIFNAFEIDSDDFKKGKIKQDAFWWRDVLYKAKENETTVEEELNKAVNDWKAQSKKR